MFVRRTISALFLGAALLAAAPASAAETAAPAAVTAASDKAADQILGAMGIKRTLEVIIPSMMTEFEQNVATTRPDLRDPLRQTLQALKPTFDKQALDIYTQAKGLLASLLTEKELVETSAFFTSPTGQKFLATEPVFFQRFNDLLAPWRQKVSGDIVAQARAELKKKGLEF